MLRTMMRMMNAFIIGKRDAVMAENILVSSFTRPKSLTIRRARSSRISQFGKLNSP